MTLRMEKDSFRQRWGRWPTVRCQDAQHEKRTSELLPPRTGIGHALKAPTKYKVARQVMQNVLKSAKAAQRQPSLASSEFPKAAYAAHDVRAIDRTGTSKLSRRMAAFLLEAGLTI